MGKKNKTPADGIRPFKVIHQIVSLSRINFQRQTIIGFTELTIVPIIPNLVEICLNAKQCRIYRVTFNDTLEVPFEYNDPTMLIYNLDETERSLDKYSSAHLEAVTEVSADNCGGELGITISPESEGYVQMDKPLRVGIEFSLEKPSNGLHFVIPNGKGSLAQRGAHMYTNTYENSSRLWFPCVDAFSEVCTWKLEFTVDNDMTAVSCGDLVNIIQTPDHRMKTYHYFLKIPTSAPLIGFAVGPFQIIVNRHLHEVSHFCLPGLRNNLKSSCQHVHKMLEFYEESLSSRYPYTCYKQVFVDEAVTNFISFASLSIFSTNLLHPKQIIDQVYKTRIALADAIAQQFFGCFIGRRSWSDCWLTSGLSSYLSGLYVKKCFGNNYYREMIHTELKDVVLYEDKHGGIILDPSEKPNEEELKVPAYRNTSTSTFHFFVNDIHTMSPLYVSAMQKKSHLIMRMLENRVGNQFMLQVLNKLLSLAYTTAQSKRNRSKWHQMLIDSSSFSKTIYIVSGKDIGPFMDQWVRSGGHARFTLTFSFHRKRNALEMEIRQDNIYQRGIRKYVGPIIITIQELDGTFAHTLQIETTSAKTDLSLHSKSRRNKKRKIPLWTGEEVDMNLSGMESDSPVLWVRLDPDMTILREVIIEQSDCHWQYELRHERDVTAQFDSILALEKFPTPSTRDAYLSVIEDEKMYISVRCRAAMSLTKVYNALDVHSGEALGLITLFKKLYGSLSSPNIIRLNDFSNISKYMLLKDLYNFWKRSKEKKFCERWLESGAKVLKEREILLNNIKSIVYEPNYTSDYFTFIILQTLPLALSGLRDAHGLCPPDIQHFILNLLKYNNNTRNRYSDNYYRSALVEAISHTITPIISFLSLRSSVSAQSLSPETKMIVEPLVNRLNIEKRLPTYKYTLTIACLKTIRILQKFGHLPNNPLIFKPYIAYGHFVDVRLCAFEALVDYTKLSGRWKDLDYLLNVVLNDPDPSIRVGLARLLCNNPPFNGMDSEISNRIDREELVHKLWYIINERLFNDSRLRCSLVDLYFTLYGRRKPLILNTIEINPFIADKMKRSVFKERPELYKRRPVENGVLKRRSNSPFVLHVLDHGISREKKKDKVCEPISASDILFNKLKEDEEEQRQREQKELEEKLAQKKEHRKRKKSHHRRHHRSATSEINGNAEIINSEIVNGEVQSVSLINIMDSGIQSPPPIVAMPSTDDLIRVHKKHKHGHRKKHKHSLNGEEDVKIKHKHKRKNKLKKKKYTPLSAEESFDLGEPLPLSEEALPTEWVKKKKHKHHRSKKKHHSDIPSPPKSEEGRKVENNKDNFHHKSSKFSANSFDTPSPSVRGNNIIDIITKKGSFSNKFLNMSQNNIARIKKKKVSFAPPAEDDEYNMDYRKKVNDIMRKNMSNKYPPGLTMMQMKTYHQKIPSHLPFASASEVISRKRKDAKSSILIPSLPHEKKHRRHKSKHAKDPDFVMDAKPYKKKKSSDTVKGKVGRPRKIPLDPDVVVPAVKKKKPKREFEYFKDADVPVERKKKPKRKFEYGHFDDIGAPVERKKKPKRKFEFGHFDDIGAPVERKKKPKHKIEFGHFEDSDPHVEKKKKLKRKFEYFKDADVPVERKKKPKRKFEYFGDVDPPVERKKKKPKREFEFGHFEEPGEKVIPRHGYDGRQRKPTLWPTLRYDYDHSDD